MEKSQKLSSRERLLRTVSGKQVDRIPIVPPIPWHPLAPEPEPGDWKTLPNYQDLIPLVEKHCDFLVHLIIPEGDSKNSNSESQTVEEYTRRAAYGGIFDRRFFLAPIDCIEEGIDEGTNGIQTITYTVHTPKGDLKSVEQIYPGMDTSWMTEPLVKTVEDAQKLMSIVYTFKDPDMEAYERDVEKLGDRGVPVCFVTTPMVMVSHMTDLQKFLEWSITERPLVERMIEVSYERVSERLRYVLERGVDAIFRFGGSEQATPPLMSHRFFEDFILKYEAPLWKMVRDAGRIVWVHCHGRVSSVLDDFINGGVQMLDPVEPSPQGDIDIAEAKRRAAKGSLTLIGNIEQSDLRHRAPDEIEELVRYAVCEEGRDHFILGHSDVVISEIDTLTRENIVTYIEAGVKYGTFDADEC
jgi:hypothetical protein